MHQFPSAFEFNTTLLLFLAHHVYTCKYGTFLCNNDLDREKMSIQTKTVSIWSYVNTNLEQFKSLYYEPTDKKLCPTSSLAVLKFWKEYFLQYSPMAKNCHTQGSSSQKSVYQVTNEEYKDVKYRKALDEIQRLKEVIQHNRHST